MTWNQGNHAEMIETEPLVHMLRDDPLNAAKRVLSEVHVPTRENSVVGSSPAHFSHDERGEIKS